MGQYCFARWRLSSSSVTLLADRRHHLNTHYLQQASKTNLATSSFASDTTVHVYKLNLLTYLLFLPSYKVRHRTHTDHVDIQRRLQCPWTCRQPPCTQWSPIRGRRLKSRGLEAVDAPVVPPAWHADVRRWQSGSPSRRYHSRTPSDHGRTHVCLLVGRPAVCTVTLSATRLVCNVHAATMKWFFLGKRFGSKHKRYGIPSADQETTMDGGMHPKLTVACSSTVNAIWRMQLTMCHCSGLPSYVAYLLCSIC